MMKFIHKLTIVLALGGICGLAACSDDDQGFLKRNLREMSFPYVESSDTFTIRATGDWQISLVGSEMCIRDRARETPAPTRR